MSMVTAFLIYAALFRLAIIAAGGLAIYLGYRLFLWAGTRSRRGDNQTEAGIKGGDFELSVKNAAPGTVFAFFGSSRVRSFLSPLICIDFPL
jgi:hypothetical protein